MSVWTAIWHDHDGNSVEFTSEAFESELDAKRCACDMILSYVHEDDSCVDTFSNGPNYDFSRENSDGMTAKEADELIEAFKAQSNTNIYIFVVKNEVRTKYP